ncbi:hypothetical protein S40285_06231 [Stachybotrys chlorohalonatus IBT 40285]|uniref:25S rRNA (Uridine(2843)-N(3))-methyltransferase n=1 Tax=Stachybotrys chlorohalonatus (strain IBT 40285) TaxID=1283841 RepID=A0A084QEI7_STAC4|nr:hypothetical protein S40285_06231 [Stachybotrys chlorohalonata IBT 40285]
MVKKQSSSKQKPSKPKQSASTSETSTALDRVPQLSPKEQQRLLDIFSQAFGQVLSAENFAGLLQEIKQALYNRDFATAFGREDYLEAYAARWSPTRALAYASAFLHIKDHIISNVVTTPDPGSGDGGSLKMLCVGGCAAEQLAFASYLHETSYTGRLTLLDSAPWCKVVSHLQSGITSAPALSKYASAATKSSNVALLDPAALSVNFVQEDVLALDQKQLVELAGTEPLLVTLLFTLNELYTYGGLAKTTKLLRQLGQALPNGSLLLVVDSPGSYSEVAVGQEKKRYPMAWLLDHTLQETKDIEYSWKKLESHDSIWFRLPEGLVYPIPLENMRYQMHLYRLLQTPS